jgi:hypothetical protein
MRIDGDKAVEKSIAAQQPEQSTLLKSAHVAQKSCAHALMGVDEAKLLINP